MFDKIECGVDSCGSGEGLLRGPREDDENDDNYDDDDNNNNRQTGRQVDK